MEDLLEDHPILNQQTEMSTFNMFFKTPVEPTPQEPTVIQPSTDKFLHTIRPTLHLVVTAPNTDETRDYSTHIVSVLTSSGINVILEFQNPSDLSLCFLEDDDNLLILTAELSWSLQSSFQLHSKLNGQMRNVTYCVPLLSIKYIFELSTKHTQAPSVLSTLYESLNPFVTVPAAEQCLFILIFQFPLSIPKLLHTSHHY
ncbi:hypothetical protein BLNAU_15452 [Blattamonas nauphoetae]|uniref:Uncharacterized protein n=1 Tax=Blattamonas nauphoetae TaxID=2049346 RepID=A0ABQ9XE48_9EUKA|nr:hypothetical protein BLNAU_15452 [Blattamonas nauphoetae]